MTKKERILYPKPRSAFLLVKCINCGAEKVIFSGSSSHIKCDSCGQTLAVPAGGRAKITAQIIKKMD
ncbi:MAG: 30S ribosomal protein S27e [Conexivisphaerales archaeon]